MRHCNPSMGEHMTDINTRAWYITDELNAWAEKYHNQQWRKAAIKLGEELAIERAQNMLDTVEVYRSPKPYYM